jgi:hypothetical protein
LCWFFYFSVHIHVHAFSNHLCRCTLQQKICKKDFTVTRLAGLCLLVQARLTAISWRCWNRFTLLSCWCPFNIN